MTKAKIRQKLQGKREKKHQPGVTPMMVKDKWVKKEIEELQNATELAQVSDTLA